MVIVEGDIKISSDELPNFIIPQEQEQEQE